MVGQEIIQDGRAKQIPVIRPCLLDFGGLISPPETGDTFQEKWNTLQHDCARVVCRSIGRKEHCHML